jgi:ketosteroid isomerase-like protein
MKKLFLILSAALFAACNSQQNQSSSSSKTDDAQVASATDHSVDITAIMKADSAWDKASEAKSADGWLSYYSDDAIMMPPGENACKDKASREESIKKMFAAPGMSLRFQSTKVDVSQMGDLGYAVGVYQYNAKDPNDKDYHETDKYCETWKKQPDGAWKCIVDIWNADPAK